MSHHVILFKISGWSHGTVVTFFNRISSVSNDAGGHRGGAGVTAGGKGQRGKDRYRFVSKTLVCFVSQ